MNHKNKRNYYKKYFHFEYYNHMFHLIHYHLKTIFHNQIKQTKKIFILSFTLTKNKCPLKVVLMVLKEILSAKKSISQDF